MIKLADLGPGEMFADYSAINGTPMQYSVVSLSSCQVLFLPVDLIRKELPTKAFEYFAEMSRDYPEDFYLRKTFFEMNEWKSMKGPSLSNVVNDHMTLQSRKDQ